MISYWASWTEPYTDEGVADYAAYCKALVARYKDRIHHWEIWNEPNIFFWKGPKEMYPKLLSAAYAAIKEVDPDAHVMGCSTAGIDLGFIKMVMDANAPFDILTVHPYRSKLFDTQFIEELEDTFAFIQDYVTQPFPIWITEMGWASNLYEGVSEREQAHLLARIYLCAFASDVVGTISWYDFREDCENPYYNECCFGITNTNMEQLKPAYRSLGQVGRFMAETHPASFEKQEAPDDILAYTVNGKEHGIVLWNTGASKLLHISSTHSELKVYNLMGERVRLFDVTEDPLFSDEMDASHWIVAVPEFTPLFFKGEATQDFNIKPFVELDYPATPFTEQPIQIGYHHSLSAIPFSVKFKMKPPRSWNPIPTSPSSDSKRIVYQTYQSTIPGDYPI